MAQHDYVLDNQAGSSFRSDLNNALSAIVSNNSGASAPTTFAYMLWADTTNGVMKQRNAANTNWVTLFRLADAGGIQMPVRSVAATASLTLSENGVVVRATATATFGLPNVASLTNGFHFGYKVEGGTFTLDPASNQTIDGGSTLAMVTGEEGLAFCDGSAWRVIRGLRNVNSMHNLNVTSRTTTRDFIATGVSSVANLSASSVSNLRHPGVIDAWVKFAGATSAIAASHGISTVSRTATGNWTVYVSSAFSSGDYMVIGPICTDTGASVSGGMSAKMISQTGSYCSFSIGRTDTGAYVDPSAIWIGFAGLR